MRALVMAMALLFCWCVRAGEPWGIVRGGGFADVVLSDCDASGAVTLTDGQVRADAEELVFTRSVAIGRISLSNRTLRVSAAADGIVLTTDGTSDMFRLDDGNWTFAGLSFKGEDTARLIARENGFGSDKAHYFGGAIDCLGGTLAVTNCAFANLVSRFNGGAISARLMDGDMTVTDCSFTGNQCGALNGTGGAIYVSGVLGQPLVTLRLLRDAFEGNAAQSGGAVTTVHVTYDNEAPVRLDLDGCAFIGNDADFDGGALFVGADAVVTNSVFADNASALQGGAISVGGYDDGVPISVQVFANTTFRGNVATNDLDWTCGGAIAVDGENCDLSVDGRYVVFEGNAALAETAGGFGGAIYSGEGSSASVAYARFLDNRAQVGGGAIYAGGEGLSVSTSIFSNNVVCADGYGGAISVEYSELAVTNTTVRYSNEGAVDIYKSDAEIVNTVVVDNNGDADIAIDGLDARLIMNYSAYGAVSYRQETVGRILIVNCLGGENASIYDGGSLFLIASGTNRVAVLGQPQSAGDHLNVQYGWAGRGYSMGAYECPAPSFRIYYDLNDDPTPETVTTNRAINHPDNPHGYFQLDLPVEIYSPTRPCYEFVGWVVNSNRFVEADTNNPAWHYTIPENTVGAQTFQAVWHELYAPTIYDIRYDLNDGETGEAVNDERNPHAYHYTDTLIRFLPPSRPGYCFTGWRWQKDDGMIEEPSWQDVVDDQLVPLGIDSPLVLQATWEKAWNIGYQEGEGVVYPEGNPTNYSASILPLVIGENVFAPAKPNEIRPPTRTGYDFDKWQWKHTGVEEPWTDFTGTRPIPTATEGDLTLRPVWTPVVYLIVYDLDGGENDPDNPDSYTVEDTPIVLKKPSKEDATFQVWEALLDGEWQPLPDGTIPEGMTGILLVRAKWSAMPDLDLDVAWYHNRTDGLYYPGIALTLVEGAASSVTGLTFTCGDRTFALPEAKLVEFQNLAVGETLHAGVDPATFVKAPNSEDNFGYVPPADRLGGGWYDPTRDLDFFIDTSATVAIDDPLTQPVVVTMRPRKPVRMSLMLSSSVPVAAPFLDFKVADGVLTGRTEVPVGATVTLYGCATLGGGWTELGAVDVKPDGTFRVAAPAGMCFFQLKAEVSR